MDVPRGHSESCPSPVEDCTCGFSELFWAEVEANARAGAELTKTADRSMPESQSKGIIRG